MKTLEVKCLRKIVPINSLAIYCDEQEIVFKRQQKIEV